MSEGYEQPLTEGQRRMIEALGVPKPPNIIPNPHVAENNAREEGRLDVHIIGGESLIRKRQELQCLLTDCRNSLKRWAARYADSEHARKAQHEAVLLVQRLDEWLLKL